MAFTLEGYKDMLNRLVSESANLGERLLVVPANEMIAEIDFRITQEGKDSEGQKIGDYSKKKSWATIAAFDNKGNFKPEQRKDGKGRRRSITLEEGYLELRRIQGYRVDRVVLERTGAAIKNIKQAFNESDAFVEVGFTDENEAIKIRSYEDRTTQAPYRRREILSPSAQEIENVRQAQIDIVQEFIRETFGTSGQSTTQ